MNTKTEDKILEAFSYLFWIGDEVTIKEPEFTIYGKRDKNEIIDINIKIELL